MPKKNSLNLARGFIAILISTWLYLPVQADAPDPGLEPGKSSADVDLDDKLLFLPIISATHPAPLGELSDGWYLMLDDEHIQLRDVERIYHPFEKYPGNPVLRADRTWEGRVVQLYGTVLPGFRMWYSSYNYTQNKGQVLYAESSDGLSWNKPDLNGNGQNTLFGGQNSNLVSVMHTPQDLNVPFKLLVYQNGSFNGYMSQDGLSTVPYSENPLIATGSDVAHFYFDHSQDRYRASIKESETILDVQRRVIRLMDSDDLVAWDKNPNLLTPDINDDSIYAGFYPNFYGMPIFPIGEQYIGLLWILKARDKAGLIGPVHVQIASSHDGTQWNRQEGNRVAMLDLGRPGEWDDGQIYTSSRPLHVGSQLWLYYSGCNQEHGINLSTTVCSIGLAKAPYNRLASLTGSGIVLTETLEPTGSILYLNYDGSKGALKAELLSDGMPISGYEAANCLPLTENSQDQPVIWSGVDSLPVTPFQIKFYLEDCSIFAFRMGEP